MEAEHVCFGSAKSERYYGNMQAEEMAAMRPECGAKPSACCETVNDLQVPGMP